MYKCITQVAGILNTVGKLLKEQKIAKNSSVKVKYNRNNFNHNA